MFDRKAEIARKKARLEELVRAKDERRRVTELRDVDEATVHEKTANPGEDGEERTELDNVLSSLGVATVCDVLSGLSVDDPAATPEEVASPGAGPWISSPVSTATCVTLSARLEKLSHASVQCTDVPPREPITYTKHTQTVSACDDLPIDDKVKGDKVNDKDMVSIELPLTEPARFLPREMETQTIMTSSESQLAEAKHQIRTLTDEEKRLTMSNDDFQIFFARTSRLMERALGEAVDIFTDYAAGGDGDIVEANPSRTELGLVRRFHDDCHSSKRAVTSLDESAHFPELLLAGYGANVGFPQQPDGVCLVWNSKYKKTTPEYVFHCQSEVTAVAFARFHPNLAVGGTRSGQIVLWDNRATRRTPVQCSPLTTACHTQPVVSLAVVGTTDSSHDLVSVSSDGHLRSWSLYTLAAPQEKLELVYKCHNSVVATCARFVCGDANNFVVGCEEGGVHSACRRGAKVGITRSHRGHHSLVSGISTHAAHRDGYDFSHLFLTSSFDWTLKLWSTRDTTPLCSFQDGVDYATDVAWSPTHPSLFAAVDCGGQLSLWDLNRGGVVPEATVVVEGSPALNRVVWVAGGLEVAVGDAAGSVWVYRVGDKMALPLHDEWGRFAYGLRDIRDRLGDGMATATTVGVR